MGCGEIFLAIAGTTDLYLIAPLPQFPGHHQGIATVMTWPHQYSDVLKILKGKAMANPSRHQAPDLFHQCRYGHASGEDTGLDRLHLAGGYHQIGTDLAVLLNHREATLGLKIHPGIGQTSIAIKIIPAIG
jgi:hypothetical protein